MVKKEEIDKLISIILNSIEESEIIIFNGAGISYDSGNLLADDIRYSILSSLEYEGEKLISDEIIELLKKRTIQFEDFINRMYDDMATDKKKEIFSNLFNIIFGHGNPNLNHSVLSKLLKSNFVEKIYTTNFDLHIEKAFNGDPPLSTLILGINENKSPRYIKLHGCISEPDKIDTLLTRIASQTKYNDVKPLMEDLLINGKHKAILFIGYSFSDIYDIVKAILEIDATLNTPKIGSTKTIYILAHENKAENYDIYTNIGEEIAKNKLKTINEYNSLVDRPTNTIDFKNFKTVILRYNTSDLIQRINEHFNFNLKTNNSIDHDLTKEAIKKWINSLDNYFKLLMGWRFNFEAGQEYFICNEETKRELMSKALNNALKCCNIITNKWKSLEKEMINNGEHKDTIEIRPVLNLKHKAITLASLGRFDESEQILKDLILNNDKLSGVLKEWSKLDVFNHLLRLQYYKVLSSQYSSDELKELIIEYETQYKELIKDSIYLNQHVALDIEWQIAALKMYAGVSGNSDVKYFEKAIKIFEKEGRVEYLAFVYMEYAKFLNTRNSDRYIEYNEKAKYLFDKLGYKEYLRFCL
ncbi:MAG: hypothetical protein FGO69_10415 [Methanobacterium sp.]|nr:MAG: hypothetical protein FGO69_10415 [Methanobacterium sp.]